MVHLPSGSGKEIIPYLLMSLVSGVATNSNSGDLLTVLARIIEPIKGREEILSKAKL